MKRSIRQALRCALVVTLATFVGISPASAGWLLKRMRGGETAPNCCKPDQCSTPAPVCCEPEPICCASAPEPTCGEPVAVAAMAPADCGCGNAVMEAASYSDGLPMDSPMMGESAIQGDVMFSEPAPMMDSGMGMPMESGMGMGDMGMESTESTPPVPEDIDDVESPNSDSDAGKTSSAKPPTDEGMGDSAMGGESVMGNDNEPSPFGAASESAEPETTPEPEPEPSMDSAPKSSTDDLFGDGTPEPEPNADSVDDLFGDPSAPSNEPSNEAPMQTDPAPADDGMDDLFGGGDTATPDPVMPADPAPADSGMDDLFGGDSPAAEPAMPADSAPADSGLDDLFGGSSDAPAMDAPSDDGGMDSLFGDPPATDTPEAPADGGMDDLFGDPPANDNNKGTADLDDLFGQAAPAQPELVKTPDAEMKVVSETVSQPTDVFENTEVRTWVDNTGLYRTVGRLIKINKENIKVLKSNGKTCTVPMSRLSQSDSDYVASLANETYVVAMLSQ